MEIKTREIPATKLINIYIADDGTEFKTRWECEKYEKEKFLKSHKVIDTAITGLRDFEDEHPAIIYNIENHQDWLSLAELVWYDHQDPKTYPGPGKYIVIQYDGGDYPDDYYVHKVEDYVNELLKDAIKYREDILKELNKFNS